MPFVGKFGGNPIIGKHMGDLLEPQNATFLHQMVGPPLIGELLEMLLGGGVVNWDFHGLPWTFQIPPCVVVDMEHVHGNPRCVVVDMGHVHGSPWKS